MTAQQIDGHVRRTPWYLFMGLTLLVVGYMADGMVMGTGFMLTWFGACCGSLGAWRTERGLWMLALVFLPISGFMYAGLLYASIADAVAGVRATIWVTVDATFATTILGWQVKFLWTVLRRNRMLGQEPDEITSRGDGWLG